MTKLQKKLFQLSETDIRIHSKMEGDTDEMWKVMDNNIERCMPFLNETIERWN